jgi:hypothetical protein
MTSAMHRLAGYSTNPLSPTGKEALWSNLMHKQAYLACKSTDKLSA